MAAVGGGLAIVVGVVPVTAVTPLAAPPADCTFTV